MIFIKLIIHVMGPYHHRQETDKKVECRQGFRKIRKKSRMCTKKDK